MELFYAKYTKIFRLYFYFIGLRSCSNGEFMNCFNHDTKSGIGICKYCVKSICRECYQEVEGILCCKTDRCKIALSESIEMDERAKKIYYIGKYKGKKLNATGLFSTFLGFIMAGVGVTSYLSSDRELNLYDFYLFAAALLIILMGLWRLFGKDRFNL